MEEIFAFINSLRDMDSDNFIEYCDELRNMIINADIDGAEKNLSMNYSANIDIKSVGVCLHYYKSSCYNLLSVSIKNKFLYFDGSEHEYYLLFRLQEDVDNEKFAPSKYSSKRVKNGSIDWLLDQKPTKSARN